MQQIHRVIGFAIVGGFLVLFVWGLALWLRTRLPGEWYWRLLAALQVSLALQLVGGVVLLLLGGTQPLLHYLYGALFPGIALVVAHVLGRGMEQERDALLIFCIVAFVCFGLSLRALATGLGLP